MQFGGSRCTSKVVKGKISESVKMNVKVSVIMSIYSEPEQWLSKSIDSILNQTFKHFEFIVINDKPDNITNKRILEDYVVKDSRIKIIENEVNVGLTKSLNKALKVAKGKYIARMDADDIAMPLRLEKQFNLLESNENIIACGTDINFINEQGGLLKKHLKTSFTSENIKNIFPLYNPIYHPTLFFRRKILLDNNLTYNEEFKYAQDYEFIKDLLFIGHIVNIEERLLDYRISNSQISNTKIFEQNNYACITRLGFIKREYNIRENSIEKIYHSLLSLKEKPNVNNAQLNNSIVTMLLNFNLRKSLIWKGFLFSRMKFKYRLRLLLKIFMN